MGLDYAREIIAQALRNVICGKGIKGLQVG
jgi:hypothetical protein